MAATIQEARTFIDDLRTVCARVKDTRTDEEALVFYPSAMTQAIDIIELGVEEIEKLRTEIIDLKKSETFLKWITTQLSPSSMMALYTLYKMQNGQQV